MPKFNTWHLAPSENSYSQIKCEEAKKEEWLLKWLFDKLNPFSDNVSKEDVKIKTKSNLDKLRGISFADLVKKAVFENKQATKHDIAYYSAIYNWTEYIAQESVDLLVTQKKLWVNLNADIISWNENISTLLLKSKQLQLQLEQSFRIKCSWFKSPHNHKQVANDLHIIIYEIVNKINQMRSLTLEISRDKVKSNFELSSYDYFKLQLNILSSEESIYANEYFWFLLDEITILSSLWSNWNMPTDNPWITPDFSLESVQNRQEQILKQIQSFWKDMSNYANEISSLANQNVMQEVFKNIEEISNNAKKIVWVRKEKTYAKLGLFKHVAIMIAWKEPSIRNTSRQILKTFSTNNWHILNEFKSLNDQLNDKNSEITKLIQNPNHNWNLESNIEVIKTFFEYYTKLNSKLVIELISLRDELIQIPLDQKKVIDWYSNLESLYWSALATWAWLSIAWWFLGYKTIKALGMKWPSFLKNILKLKPWWPFVFLFPWQAEILEWKGGVI